MFLFFFSRATQALKVTQIAFLNFAKTLSLANPELFTQNRAKATIPNLQPLNSKISSYVKNGLVEEARKLFDKMPQKNTVTWNAMIRGHFLDRNSCEALQLFYRMPDRDIVSYNTVIAGLMQCGDLDGARYVFDGMPSRDVVTWNSMVAGYIRNGMIDTALHLFDGMPLKDVISWNLIVGGLVNCGDLALAEEYFGRSSVQDVVSWTIMISGLCKSGRIVEACKLFENMPSRDVRACNAMMVGYIENGHIKTAIDLFRKMPERDFDSWNELVSGLVRSKKANDAIRLFREMPTKCQKTWNSILLELIRNGLVKEAHAFLEKSPYSDVVSWTNLLVGYFGLGEVGGAIKIFDLMPSRDTTAWNATVFGFGENGQGEEGLKLFIRMKESGPSPDKATFTSVLTICSDLPTLHFGKQTHANVIRVGFNSYIEVSNAMVTMYARCGNMHSALLEFSSMPSHDVISWNSLICGFAYHGNGTKALEMFERMRLTDVVPNHITFVGVLSACSHAGLVEQGKYYFDFMKSKYSLWPTSEHYTCIMDLLGRFGLIDEAMTFLDQMRADGVEVPASVWGALLGACRIYKNIEVGKIAGEKILEVDPCNSGVYLILVELLLSGGRREDAGKILARMKEKGVKKQPGCSWIEVNNSARIFLSGDSSHPDFCRICCILDLIYMEMEIKSQNQMLLNFHKYKLH